MTSRFKVGQTYTDRSICDHDCIFSFEITKRTAKQITFIYLGKEFRRGVKIDDDDHEFCYPLGTYSMCCCIRA